MIGCEAVLRLNLFFDKWFTKVSGTDMFTSSYIQLSNPFTIRGLAGIFTLKLINDTKSKIFGNPIFEMNVVT